MKIQYLALETSRLQDQLQFYQEVLGLPIQEIQESAFQVKIGFSVLEFRYRKSATPYHVAFHIPAYQEEKALVWLEERTTILRKGQDKIIDFPSWRARSLYFYDADRNIVEFISRKHLYPSSEVEFSERDILGISEIGMATGDVAGKFKYLNENFGLQKFTGDYENFCATGDEQGLFIVINKDNKGWIPTGDQAFASPFDIQIWEEQKSFQLSFINDRLNLYES